MTLNDAFHQLMVEQLEEALAADAEHGFPQDVFGLARLMLRTFSILAPDCVKPDGSSAEPLEVDRAIEQRMLGMVELEQLKLGHFEETAWSSEAPSDTRH